MGTYEHRFCRAFFIKSSIFQRNRRLTIFRIVLRESFNDPILATERHFHFKKKSDTRDFI